MIRKLLYAFSGVILLGLLGVCASVWLAHDFDYSHTAATARLPEFPSQLHEGEWLYQIKTGSRSFRARVAGIGGTRGNLILLHGFPETSIMWQPLIMKAAEAGYQVIAFDQRGYSPGARPDDEADYAISHLTADVLAVADVAGFDTFNLVGHDWGAAVGWSVVLQHPSRVRSWTSLSIPHIASFAAALASDPEQQEKSAYMVLFRMPFLPEAIFSFNRFSVLSGMYAEHREKIREEYLAVFREPGAITAALNWYRAADNVSAPGRLEVELPVLFIWGNEDPAVGRKGVELQSQYLKGPYRVVELDAGHWLMESHPSEVTVAVLAHIDAAGFPDRPPSLGSDDRQ